jgi:hypothetical protein
MFESIQSFVPLEWRGTMEFLISGLAWIPGWQADAIALTWYGATPMETALFRAFLLLPTCLLVAAMWCTMVSLYTVPFRSGRGTFILSLLMAWWDAARSVWLFWAGTARFALLLVGWVWNLLRLAVQLTWRTIKTAATSPLALLDWTSRQYFQPGVPWIAFFLLILWTAIEATIFTFTLRPTLNELLADLVGFEPNGMMLITLLWLFLFFLIAGSFACVQVLAEAIQQRKPGQIVQMLVVELFVMFFEVLFLYRELIDAITPWLAQQTSEQLQLGIVGTLALASFGWIGVRGMIWFLFGRFGTPALLGVLARQTVTRDRPAAEVPLPVTGDVWKAPIAALKSQTEWLKKETREAVEVITVPVLQLLAAGVNFAVVVLLGRPHFVLPFRSLEEVLASTPSFGDHAPARPKAREAVVA